MNNLVKVTVIPSTGLVFNSTGISPKDGKEYGYMRLEEVIEEGLASLSFTAKGYVQSAKANSALLTISKQVFDKAKIEEGQTMVGKIIIKESTTKNPFKAKQDAKRAGKDGPVCLFNGLPIYRETEFTTDLSAQNVLVAYTSTAPVAVKAEAILNS